MNSSKKSYINQVQRNNNSKYYYWHKNEHIKVDCSQWLKYQKEARKTQIQGQPNIAINIIILEV